MARSALFLAGFFIILAGFVLVIVGSASQTGVSSGGFILIGPFPIVFGTGGNGGQLAILSVAAGVILIVMTAIWAWRLSQRGRDASKV